MTALSDLRSRTLYAVVMIVVGLACLACVAATEMLVIVLAGVLASEIAAALDEQKHRTRDTMVALLFGTVSLGGFAVAGYLRLQPHGFSTLVLVALVVAVTDSFAYLCGKRFGKRKFAPTISPNKTVEGVVCGVAVGEIVLLGLWLFLQANHHTSLPLGSLPVLALLPWAAVFGDLLESKAKRLLSVKDFGTILGEHGGVADRFDGMTAAFLFYGVVQTIVSLAT